MIDSRWSRRVLVLNSDYQPLSIIPLATVNWQEAIKLVIANNAKISDHLENLYIRSEKLKINYPSVIILNKFVKNKYKVKLSKTNIFIRDNYSCCFCKNFLFYEKDKLTIDHIIPKSKGGKSSWDNLVSSCVKCNNDKGNKIIYPDILPSKPSYSELIKKRTQLPIYIDHDSWKKYLYNWNEENIIVKKNFIYFD